MNPSLYTKPVDQLMREGKISVHYKSFRKEGFDKLGQPEYKAVTEWWGAYCHKRMSVNGEGATPREAIIDLYKKLDHA